MKSNINYIPNLSVSSPPSEEFWVRASICVGIHLLVFALFNFCGAQKFSLCQSVQASSGFHPMAFSPGPNRPRRDADHFLLLVPRLTGHTSVTLLPICHPGVIFSSGQEQLFIFRSYTLYLRYMEVSLRRHI